MPSEPSAAAVMAARAVEQLQRADVDLDAGLTSDELTETEARFGFGFNSVHRELLSRVLPVGEHWPNWRSGGRRELQRRLSLPREGVLFDVLQHGFWPAAWGGRPANLRTAERVARNKLAKLPTLVPLRGHRFMAAAPAPVDGPVLYSIERTDVRNAGTDLNDFLARELLGRREAPGPGPSSSRIAFWSDLAEGQEPSAS